MEDKKITGQESQETVPENNSQEIVVEAKKSDKKSSPEASSKKKKEPRGRHRLFDDYQYKEYKNKKGKTKRKKVYTGKHYGFAVPKEWRKDEKAYIGRIKLFYSIVWVIMTALWVCATLITKSYASGAIKTDLQYIYIVLPYYVGALPLLLTGYTLIEFIFTKGNRHEKAFAESLKQNLKGQCVTALVCGVLTILSETVFVFINFKEIEFMQREIMFVIYMAAYTAASVIWLRLQANFAMEEKK